MSPDHPLASRGSALMHTSPKIWSKLQITNWRANFWCQTLGSKWTTALEEGKWVGGCINIHFMSLLLRNHDNSPDTKGESAV